MTAPLCAIDSGINYVMIWEKVVPDNRLLIEHMVGSDREILHQRSGLCVRFLNLRRVTVWLCVTNGTHTHNLWGLSITETVYSSVICDLHNTHTKLDAVDGMGQ